MSSQSSRSKKLAFRPSLEAMEPIVLLTTNGAIVESLTQAGAFTINGSTKLTSSGALMTNALDQSSSIWFNNLLTSDHYTVSFNFSLSNPGGIGWADGFTFAVADSTKTGSNAVGTVGDGEGIGYRGMSGYAIEFDTFYNSYNNDPTYTHVGLDLNGSVVSAAVSKPLPFEIKGVGTVTASITYAAGSITVSIAKPGGPSYQVFSATVPANDIPATGRVGLTAATAAGKETAYINDFNFQPQNTEPKSLTWDDTDGGVDFSYLAPDPLPFSLPIDLYWSSSPTFNAVQDKLAYATLIEEGEKPAALHIAPTLLTAPPDGTNYLLAVLDPNHMVLPQNPDNTLPLVYNPGITVTGTYDGSTNPNVIGRFLAIPGLVNEKFIDKLSPSLAALRPSVVTFINNGESLEAYPDVTGLGSWDGLTYETDGFDPGSLSKSAALTTIAQTDDKTSLLAEGTTTLEVQPLPTWYESLQDPTIVFTPELASTDGILQGSYKIEGIIANLAQPINDTIQQNIAFVGGKSIAATANLGIAVTVPLSITSSPVVTGYAKINLNLLSESVYSNTFDLSKSTSLESGVSLTVTPQVTLDPDTLQTTGSFAVGFGFNAGGSLSNKPLYSSSPIPVYVGPVPFELTYGVSENVAYHLTAAADVIFSPGSGFALSANPNLSYVSVGITGTLTGKVTVGWYIPEGDSSQQINNLLDTSLPQYFTKGSALPALSLAFVVSGGFTFNSRFNYTGTLANPSALRVSFGGSLNPQIQSNVFFTIGTYTVSLPITSIFVTIPSLVFSKNGYIVN